MLRHHFVKWWRHMNQGSFIMVKLIICLHAWALMTHGDEVSGSLIYEVPFLPYLVQAMPVCHSSIYLSLITKALSETFCILFVDWLTWYFLVTGCCWCYLKTTGNFVVTVAMPPFTGDHPTLPELQHFPVKDGYKDIVGEIANEYQHFGILLLKDEKGNRVKSIKSKWWMRRPGNEAKYLLHYCL